MRYSALAGVALLLLSGLAAANPVAVIESQEDTMKQAMFGAGCFWGVESNFRALKGVTRAAVGYAGGKTENPTYQQVCSHTTGHAEVVRLEYDPLKVSYKELLDKFFAIHDPTTLNRQGPDVGDQYRSVIFYFDEEQKAAAERKVEQLTEAKAFPRPIVTAIEPAPTFWRAEEYHQNYYEKRGIKGGCPIR